MRRPPPAGGPMTLASEAVASGSDPTACDLVQGVLDHLPVTDFVYHHLAFTRPLVDTLVREVQRTSARRVLVIGPNELLAVA